MEKVQRYGPGAVVLGESTRFDCGAADTIGRRRSMEDVMTINGRFRGNPNEDFFGVFDGHGGQVIAEYVAMNVVPAFHEALAGLDDQMLPSAEQLSAVSASAFCRLNQVLGGAFLAKNVPRFNFSLAWLSISCGQRTWTRRRTRPEQQQLLHSYCTNNCT
jgi:hypothetical protein